MNRELIDFIRKSPSSYHAVAQTKELLRNAGFTELFENEKWQLKLGGRYFVSRNGSSLIAFKVPEVELNGMMIVAAHSDSPCFKIKDNPELKDDIYVRLSTEKYGGSIYSTWMDRPLSIAGRVAVKEEDKISLKLIDCKEPIALIPNLAIHMNRDVNDGMKINVAVDMLPLFMDVNEDVSFYQYIADLLGVNKDSILSTDLYLYNTESPVIWQDYLSSPRLDDLQCAFAGIKGLIDSKGNESMPVFCLFDNEEVGSNTRQGVSSGFFEDVLERVVGEFSDFRRIMQQSLLVSADNAHAIHPNHPECADKNHKVMMNKGIVIKTNALQRYSSDAVSVAIFKEICNIANVPYQVYANRADMPGGSTLGNIVSTRFSINTIDIGLPQLAMHSAYETAGKKDTEYLYKALKTCFEKSLVVKGDEEYIIK